MPALRPSAYAILPRARPIYAVCLPRSSCRPRHPAIGERKSTEKKRKRKKVKKKTVKKEKRKKKRKKEKKKKKKISALGVLSGHRIGSSFIVIAMRSRADRAAPHCENRDYDKEEDDVDADEDEDEVDEEGGRCTAYR